MIKFKAFFSKSQYLKNKIVLCVNDKSSCKNYSYAKRLLLTVLLSIWYIISLNLFSFLPFMAGPLMVYIDKLNNVILLLIIPLFLCMFFLVAFAISGIAIAINQVGIIRPGLYCYTLPYALSVLWVLIYFTNLADDFPLLLYDIYNKLPI